MTLISYLGVFLSLLAIPFASKRLTLPKLAFFLLLLAIHMTTTVLAFTYAHSHSSDSNTYYFDLYHFNDRSWLITSTVFIVHITQVLKQYLGATYFDAFVMFQAVGYWGIATLNRTFEEISEKVGTPPRMVFSCLLLLPTIHYWTSSIGKDGILFFAIALCTWSILNLRRRRWQFCVAVLLMMLCRAHIAVLVVASLALAAAAYQGMTLGRRLILLVPAVAALGFLALAVQTYVDFDVTDAGSVTSFLESRTAQPLSAQGNTNLAGASYPVRLASLFLRPMFYDSQNSLGIVASLENCVILLIIAYIAIHFRELFELYRKVFFIRFAVTLTVVLVLLLALVNYNVGLGLRQRTMALPPLLSLFVASWALRQRLRAQKLAIANSPVRRQQMALAATGAALQGGRQSQA